MLRPDAPDYDVVTTEPQGPTISAGRATSVGLASLLSATSGFVALLVATWVFDKPTNAQFLTFWSLLFFLFGALGGIQNETTRAVSARRAADDVHSGAGVRVVPAALGVGVATALLVGATSPLWGDRILGDGWPWLILVLAVAVVAFTGHLALCGALAGRRAWHGYAALVATESTARLVLVGAAALAGASAFGLKAGAALAAGGWLLLVLVDRRARAALPSRADATARVFLARTGQAMVASASSAALVVGFTVMLDATTPAREYALAAPFILAISLTRAPLLIPLNAYQGVAIAWFLDHPGGWIRALRTASLVILAVGAVAAGAAASVGPGLMRVIRDDYGVPSLELAGLTFAAALLALLTLTGAATLALGRHGRYAGGWAAATLVSLAILLLPMAMEPRAVLSLAIGPIVGIVVHASALSRAPRPGR